MKRSSTNLACAALIVAAAALFLALTTRHLVALGLFADELHQFPASTWILGREPSLGTAAHWGHWPLLTMPYSGALKSILYGLWMKWSGRPFDIVSWRRVGIFAVVIGLSAFLWLSRRALSLCGLAVFALLLISDATVLLASRYDWGPTALGMAIRLIWLGLWLRAENRGEARDHEAFFVGFLATFLIYEKLSYVVFLIPLAATVLFCASFANLRARMVTVAGALAGFIPLLVVNLHSHGISLRQTETTSAHELHWEWFGSFLVDFFGLGSGDIAQGYILGKPAPTFRDAEFLLVVPLLLLSIVVAWRNRNESRLARSSLYCVGFYLAIGFGTRLIPRVTWIHHWLSATPFGYAAIVTAFVSAASRRQRAAIGALISILLLVRVFNLVPVESEFASGACALRWDPSLTVADRYVVNHQDEATFILGDWGFAPGISALSNGALVPDEPFFGYPGVEYLHFVLALKPGKPVYVLTRRDSLASPETTARILADLKELAQGKELEPPAELADLRAVKVRGFQIP